MVDHRPKTGIDAISMIDKFRLGTSPHSAVPEGRGGGRITCKNPKVVKNLRQRPCRRVGRIEGTYSPAFLNPFSLHEGMAKHSKPF
jgi:hypothetical protein